MSTIQPTLGTRKPLRNEQSLTQVEKNVKAASSTLFGASELTTTPAKISEERESIPSSKVPEGQEFKIEIEKIISLIDEQITRLNKDYNEKSCLIHLKGLNRTKALALADLRVDLNVMKDQNPTEMDIINKIKETFEQKDVTKSYIRESKVKVMFMEIFKYISTLQDKKKFSSIAKKHYENNTQISSIAKKHYENNTQIDSIKITTQSLTLQKNIFSFLNAKDTQAALFSSQAFSKAKPMLKINKWRDKLIDLGIKKSILQQLPETINLKLLHHKVRALDYALRTQLKFWQLAFLSGNETLISKVIASDEDLTKTPLWGDINALHSAAFSGSVEAMEYAHKDLNISADSRDNFGFNALHAAAASGKIAAIRYLRKVHRLNPLQQNNQGSDAFDEANSELRGNKLTQTFAALTIPLEEIDEFKKN